MTLLQSTSREVDQIGSQRRGDGPARPESPVLLVLDHDDHVGPVVRGHLHDAAARAVPTREEPRDVALRHVPPVAGGAAREVRRVRKKSRSPMFPCYEHRVFYVLDSAPHRTQNAHSPSSTSGFNLSSNSTAPSVADAVHTAPSRARKQRASSTTPPRRRHGASTTRTPPCNRARRWP